MMNSMILLESLVPRFWGIKMGVVVIRPLPHGGRAGSEIKWK